jgi:hypothetical protein
MDQLSLEAWLRRLTDQAQAFRAALPPLTEADTCGGLIEPTLSALGWQVSDVSHLRRQYRHTPSDNPVDYALFLDGTPVLFVEAKSVNGDLDDHRWRNQTLAYAYHAGVAWCALTNGLEWRLYKTMAPGDASSRLFRCIKVSDPSAAKLLALISPASLKEGAASRLWEAEHAEQLVRAAYRAVVQTRDFANMVRKNLAQPLPMEAITQAIQRIGLPWEQTGETRVSVLAEPAPPAPRLAEERRNDAATNSVAIENGSDAGRSRARRERLPALFSDGRLRAGQTLRIRDRIDSEAIIIDSQNLKYKGKILSWNEWGQIVTGWPSINIYLHAETSDGILIDQLRRPL